MTDSPINAALEDEAHERENRKQRAGTIIGKLAGNKKKGKNKLRNKHKDNKSESDESEQEDEVCLVCLAPYSETKRENWIQCTECKRWAHVQCRIYL